MTEVVLITGGTGFIGQGLLQHMLMEGQYHLRVAVRATNNAFPHEVETIQVAGLSPEANWKMAVSGVATVIHMAAQVHIMRDASKDSKQEYHRVNTEGTLNLAQQAAEAGVRRFVYLSSIKVNGERTLPRKPFQVDDKPAPEDAYGISKLQAERGLFALATDTGMEVVVIRPPLVYGPGVKGNFATLMNWVAKGIPLPLGAITNNRRSFIALDNLVDLIVTCIDHPAAANHVFLASDGEDLSTADLLHRLARAMGRPARLVPVPKGLLEGGLKLLGRDDLAQRLCGSLQVDITKTCERLGWKPPVTVDEGLRRAVAPLMTGKGSP